MNTISTNVFLLVLFGVIIIAIIAIILIYWNAKKSQAPNAELKSFEEVSKQAFLMLQGHIEGLGRSLKTDLIETRQAVDLKLSEANQRASAQGETLHRSHEHSMKLVKDVTEQLTQLGETNKRVENFAEQLQSLQDILKNPKQRGILGEYYLETVLKNVLPPGSFQMQYAFKDNLIVDAAIFIKDKVIPVDSKFSLENYNRLIELRDPEERKRVEDALRQDLKNRIDETSKYIKPDEGTMDFAFMFIPSEALYYDLLVNKVGSVNARDLIAYAGGEKKVIIVSPTSFLAYLQTVLQGLKAMQIEESAKEIKKKVGDLQRHLVSYDSYMQKLGSNLGTAVNMYNSAYKEFAKIDKDVVKIAGGEKSVEVLELQKPSDDLG